MKRLLVIDDDIDICTLLSRFLSRNGFDVFTAHRGATALEIIKKDKIDIVLCDFRLGDMDGMEMLVKIKEINPKTIVIIITGYSDIKMAVNVIKAGAYDYVTKPLLPDEILLTIKKAIDKSGASEAGSALGNTNNKHPRKEIHRKAENYNKYIIGESPQAKELYKQIDLVAPTNYSVIIYGESGTGKEAVAHTIHNRSPRKDYPFVAMDCGAISKELAGSELFGHEKGSFTGALTTKIGHFEMANGGTLFLDEVVNLGYEIQASLLRVVQERKLKRIGSTKEIDLDVRIIVATNENLSESYRKGKFREDLYHRFNEFGIFIPPLRERKKDILIFANYFLEEANNELYKESRGFSEDVIEIFKTYPWPGNLRELKNIIKRAALLADGHYIESKTLPVEISNYHKFSFGEEENGNGIKSQDPSKPNLKNAALEAEYETIMTVLRQVNFNKTKAAQILNIDRKTLYNKMKAFNM
jgi:two-component system, NtrC family, response regulator HydG